VSQSNKLPAFLAYLLPVLGWLYAFMAYRQDKLVVYHTKQSMMLVITAVGAFAIWVILGWLVTFIPFAGAVVAIATFALVIALYIALLVSWIIGMVYALQAKLKPVPMVGDWAERLPID
jgi:uncharacterized membrane protein